MKLKVFSQDDPMFCKTLFTHMFFIGILQAVLSVIINLSDMVMTSYFFGSAGISAIAVSGPLGSIPSFCIMILASGCRIIFPEKIGEYDKKTANQYFSTSMTAALILTAVFSVIMIFHGERYFDIYSLSGETLTLALGYLKYYKYVYVLSPIVFLIGQMVFCDGDVKLCSIANTIYFIGNIILSLIGAIFLGIEGIGLGTLLSGLVCLLLYCMHFLKKECNLKYKPYYSLKKQIDIIKLSAIDSSYSLFSGVNGVIISAFVIKNFGAEYLAINSVVGQAVGLTALFSVAIESMLPILNTYRGEKNPDGMCKIIHLTKKWIIIMGAVITALALLIAPLYPVIFSLSDPETKRACITGIRIAALTFTFNGLVSFLTAYYNSAHHELFATVIARFKDSVFYVICFVAFGALLGVNGLWIGTMLCPLLTFVLALIAVRLLSVKDNSMMMPAPPKNIKSWDIELGVSAIMDVRDQARQYLLEKSTSGKIVKKVEFLIEEVFMLIYERNEPDKKVTAELTVICKDDIEIIFRDNGVVFDLIDEDAELASFRQYVLTGFYGKVDQKKGGSAMSFNRVCFSFENAH